jgi:hypothetical protein
MKHLAIILSLVIGTAAQAELKIGDSARYIVGTQGQTFEMLNAVTAIDGTSGKFTVQQTVFHDGAQIQQSDAQEDIADNTQNEAIFASCMQMPAELNPRFETVNVTAGSFSTCHLTQTGSDGTIMNIWFANVVFGFVKMTKEHSTDNSDMTLELKEFKKNN